MPAKVLVVEDSRAMREYVSAVLESTGDIEFEHAESGFHALQYLSRGSPDLIITDVNMPEVSGLEVLRYVRKSERLKDTPVVVISTEGHPVDRARAKAAGATLMLEKPFDPEVLKRAVSGLLEGPPG
ncbi:MAG: response regulator [Nannocystaceae bacterium]